MNNYHSRLQLLLSLLEYATPHPHEQHMHSFLPKGGEFDKTGNYILKIGKSDTLFCCHIDTVGHIVKRTDPIIKAGWIKATNKDASCLGGDDRCGMLCLIHLIENKIPGTYIFHVGEEKGTIGASAIKKDFDLSKFKRAVEFDRRDITSVITEMGVTRTCSDTFGKALADQLKNNFRLDNTGVFTDVGKYSEIIPEVTNLSVGYYNEHTSKEKINAKWLIGKFLPAILKVDWENLPIERNPKDESNKKYHYHHGYYGGHYDDDGRFGRHSSYHGWRKYPDIGYCDFCETYGEMKTAIVDKTAAQLCSDCSELYAMAVNFEDNNDLEALDRYEEEEEEETTSPGFSLHKEFGEHDLDDFYDDIDTSPIKVHNDNTRITGQCFCCGGEFFNEDMQTMYDSKCCNDCADDINLR